VEKYPNHPVYDEALYYLACGYEAAAKEVAARGPAHHT